MKLNCVIADICLPCFWSGHHLPHVQIPVWNGMSFSQIREEIKEELKQGMVSGNTENAFLLSADWIPPEKEKLADKLTRAAYAAVNRDIKPARKHAKNAFPDIEKTDELDGEEIIYAFFVFCEVQRGEK